MRTAQEVIDEMNKGIEERAKIQEKKDELIMAEIERIQRRKKVEEW